MKKSLMILWVGLCGLAIPGLSQAVPMQYTFAGEITTTYAEAGWNGPGSYPSDWAALRDGQPLSLTVLLDTDVWMDNSLNQATLLDYSDNLVVNQTPGPGLDFDSYTSILGGPTLYGFFHAESANNTIKFGWTNGVGFSDPTDFNWTLGTTLDGFSFQKTGYLGFEYEITLVDIRGYKPTVTEPASLALMSIGLLGLGFARRRKAG